MGQESTVMVYQAMQSIDSSTFTGSYMPVGTLFPKPSRIFKIVNNSTVAVTISTSFSGGATDEDFLPPSTFVLYDVCTNKSSDVPSSELPPVQFYIKGTAGTGSVYFVSLCAQTPTQNPPF